MKIVMDYVQQFPPETKPQFWVTTAPAFTGVMPR